MIPRRAIAALMSTALGLVLLFSYRTPDERAATAADGAGGSTTDGSAGSGATAFGGDPIDPQPTASATSGATVPATGAPGTGTFIGDPVRIRWGTVQVQVTIGGGALVDVAAVQMPSGDRHTRSLSQRAASVLRTSALSAQSASIDLVSGATYTSRAYAQSLQSALDAAGFPG